MRLSDLKRDTPQYVLGFQRIVTAVLFFEHGTAKLFGYPHFPQYDSVILLSLPGLAGVLEICGGMLLALGIFPRHIAFLLAAKWRSPILGITHRSRFSPC